MMKSARVALLTGAMIVLVTPAQADEVSDYDRFRLWNSCDPMDLVVEDLGQDAADIGLSVEDIEANARSRLRAARMYDPDVWPYLHLTVSVVDVAFHVRVQFFKTVKDAATGISGVTPTWQVVSVGIAEKTGANYILDTLAKYMDRFIDEYLRVNADVC